MFVTRREKCRIFHFLNEGVHFLKINFHVYTSYLLFAAGQRVVISRVASCATITIIKMPFSVTILTDKVMKFLVNIRERGNIKSNKFQTNVLYFPSKCV